MNFNAMLLENGNSWGNNGEGQQCHNKVENWYLLIFYQGIKGDY